MLNYAQNRERKVHRKLNKECCTMKRFVSILLCVLMVCVFANAFAEGKVGVSMPTKDLQRWNQDGENMQKMLEEAGYTVDL